MTKSKGSMVTRGITHLAIYTLPMLAIESVFSLLSWGRYLLPLTTLNRYQPTDGSRKFFFTTVSRNVSIVSYRMSLVTILLLDSVMIHWIRWIQGKSFRENSNILHVWLAYHNALLCVLIRCLQQVRSVYRSSTVNSKIFDYLCQRCRKKFKMHTNMFLLITSLIYYGFSIRKIFWKAEPMYVEHARDVIFFSTVCNAVYVWDVKWVLCFIYLLLEMSEMVWITLWRSMLCCLIWRHQRYN